jgi:hypothetical protein
MGCLLNSREHFGAEPKSRTERKLDVDPHRKPQVVVQQRSKYDSQPFVGQQNVVRVCLYVVHAPAVSSRQPIIHIGYAANLGQIRHERIQIQHRRNGFHAIDQRLYHLIKFRSRFPQSRSIVVFQNNRTYASDFFESSLAQVEPEVKMSKINYMLLNFNL